MRATIYLGKKELEEFLDHRGYTTLTMRRIIFREFGYKNTDQFLSDFPELSRSVLDIKMSYKSLDEYREISVLLSEMLKYIKYERDSNDKYYQRIYGVDILFLNPKVGGFTRFGEETYTTLYYHTQKAVFKREFLSEVTEKLGLYDFRMSI